MFPKLSNAVKAFMLKIDIANRQNFIYDQQIRPSCRSYAKGEAHLHSAGVNTYRLIDVLAYFGKGFDVGHESSDFIYVQAKQLPGHHDVLTPGEVRMKTHAKLQHGGDPSAGRYLSRGRLNCPRDEFKEGAFTRTVNADNAHRFTRINSEIDAPATPI